MEFPSHLRLLHWFAYPRKTLHLGFCPEHLVEICMEYNQLEKLWEGTQPLANLKVMNVSYSYYLKELPDLSNATNLEILYLHCCSALIEIPSSIVHLYKLWRLWIHGCKSLEIIPTLTNLTSLEGNISMDECSKLRIFPDIPTSTYYITMKNTSVEELSASLRLCSGLETVYISESGNLRTFSTHLPTSVCRVDLSNSGIQRITDCIKGLHNLRYLDLSNCKRLVSLPELPCSLLYLEAVNCESLERVSGPLNTPNAKLKFTNCFKLDSQVQRAIIQQSYFPKFMYWGSYCGGWALLPGREVPEEFVHRTTRNSLTIPPSAFNRVKVCIVISPKLLQDIFSLTGGGESDDIYFDCKINGNLVQSICIGCTLQAEHLIVFGSDFLSFDPSKVSTKIVLECSRSYEFCCDEFELRDYPLDIIEWGIQILTDENGSNNGGSGNDHMDTHESIEVYGKDKKKKEGSKSESGEASKERDECIANIYESVSRKRLRDIRVDVFLQELAIQENGQRSCALLASPLECSSLTAITNLILQSIYECTAEGCDYEFVSRKLSRKTTITNSTSLKRVIQRQGFQKRKKSNLNQKSSQF